ncbi:Biosynthetic peptidoglycan transglycosylase [Streptomyces microflavus]
MPKKRSGGGLTTTQQAAKFLGVAALSGAVLAGIALPAAGALGLAAKGTVEGFDEIPSNLKTPPLSQRTTILDRDGGAIATVYSRDRTVVPLKDISPYMQDAIIAIEDSRFYEHGAVDLKGIVRAMNRNVQAGGAAQGAFTLTQQYVKNVFVEEAGDDQEKVAQATRQALGRKVRGLKYAIQVEGELGIEEDPPPPQLTLSASLGERLGRLTALLAPWRRPAPRRRRARARLAGPLPDRGERAEADDRSRAMAVWRSPELDLT